MALIGAFRRFRRVEVDIDDIVEGVVRAGRRGRGAGRAARAWGSEGAGLSRFSYPRGIAVAGDSVVVTDSGNDRVQRWVFGFADWSDVRVSMMILATVTVVGMLILLYRISAPMPWVMLPAGSLTLPVRQHRQLGHCPVAHAPIQR